MEQGEAQAHIHDAITEAMRATDLLDEDQVLTGWCLCFETQSIDSPAAAGHLYGPDALTTWRAIGLIEWAKRYLVSSDDDE